MENKKLCPHCRLEVDPKASRCPHCQGKIRISTPIDKFIYGGIFLIVMIFLISSFASYFSNPTGAVETIIKPSFTSLAQERFKSIMEVSPELQNIECNSDCSIVYFNYKTIPTDLETVIRGNAVTFSRFKNVNTGSGDLTVIARKSGQDIFTCTAITVNNAGMVKDCK